jgi:hypothetical protein
MTTETEFQEELSEILWDYSDNFDISTYYEVGMLTRNKGLIIKLENGEEFEITIVRRK